MSQTKIEGFKSACNDYLSTLSIGSLRTFGRQVGVSKSTEKKKGELIEDIISVLTGEMQPAPPSLRGAPVKADFVDPKIEEEIAKLRFLYLVPVKEANTISAPKLEFVLYSPDAEAEFGAPNSYGDHRYIGQLDTVEGVSCLISLDGDIAGEKIVITVEQIRANRLREGDVIVCHAREHHAVLVATDIISVNGCSVGTETRFDFDEVPVVYPQTKIAFSNGKGVRNVEAKFVDWFIPVGYGQRCLVSAPPKAGKTKSLLHLADSLVAGEEKCEKLALLINQSPETVMEYKKLFGKNNVVATTFEDDADTHIFAAEFLTKRAKRLMETSKNVVLFIDSLSELARSYEETELSEGGKRLQSGISSKTLSYIKKILALGRATERNGSLTVIASVARGTGNPMDEDLYSVLAGVANCEIVLSGDMAARRIFPAIELHKSLTCDSVGLLDETLAACDYMVRNKILPEKRAEIHAAVVNAMDHVAFVKEIEKLL